MLKKIMAFMALITVMSFMATTAMAWNYPAETGYADIPTIGIEEMHANLQAGKGMVVDVRSGVEYNTAHIEGAINIKVGSKGFEKKLKEAAAKYPGQPIYTYCNGPTCLKSPLAAQKIIAAGITNCFAFYPGLPGWAEVHPEKTILRGKPVGPDNQLIPKSEYKAKCLGFDDFKQKTADNPNAVVIDIRDNVQRTAKLPDIKKRVLPIAMDKLIPNFLKKGKDKDKTLYIFDQVGKQAQALQYELEANGYTNYWFLKKGATSVLGKQVYRK